MAMKKLVRAKMASGRGKNIVREAGCGEYPSSCAPYVFHIWSHVLEVAYVVRDSTCVHLCNGRITKLRWTQGVISTVLVLLF